MLQLAKVPLLRRLSENNTAPVINPVMFWCGWEHNGEKKVKFSLKNMFSTLVFVPQDKNHELIAVF